MTCMLRFSFFESFHTEKSEDQVFSDRSLVPLDFVDLVLNLDSPSLSDVVRWKRKSCT